MLFSQRSACDRCRALKSRCSRETGAAKCERCQRLKIDCFYSPPRRMGRPAKKRLSQDNANANINSNFNPAIPPSSGYRRPSKAMSTTTIQSAPSDLVPTPPPPPPHATTTEATVNANASANDFQYGLGIIQSHHSADDATAWVDGFQDPLLGLLQHHHNNTNNCKMVAAEWMDHDSSLSLGFLHHHEDAADTAGIIIPESHGLPLTPPTTIGSLPNGSDDAWLQSCEQQQPHDFGHHPDSFACDTLPPSPEPPTMQSPEPAMQRLLDLQAQLFSRHMAQRPHEMDDGLSALINTTVHSTETLIEIVEGLPHLRRSVEGRRSTSPLSSSWGGGGGDSAAAGFNAPIEPPPLPPPPYQHQQQPPNYAITISLFITCYIVLLDSYEELLSALRARLQCSRQSQGPSPTSSNDVGLSQQQSFLTNHINAPGGGNLNKFNLVSSFDLDVNSVVFLLSRMMKRLHKSTESRFAATVFVENNNINSLFNPVFHHVAHKGQKQLQQQQGGGNAVVGGGRSASVSYDFQDGASQDTDGMSEASPGAASCSSAAAAASSLSPMMMMGSYALKEVCQRHQSVMESLRVIRWLADEL